MPVNPEDRLADISAEISKISAAVYGKDVRSSIVSALTKMNDNTTSGLSSAQTYANNASDSATAAASSASSASSSASSATSSKNAAASSATAAAQSADDAAAVQEYLSTWTEQFGVGHFNGRAGDVVPTDSDYPSTLIQHSRDGVARTVGDILDDTEDDLYGSSTYLSNTSTATAESLFFVKERVIAVPSVAANSLYDYTDTFTVNGNYECLGVVGFNFASSWLMPSKIFARYSLNTYDDGTNTTTISIRLLCRNINSNSAVNPSNFTCYLLMHKRK